MRLEVFKERHAQHVRITGPPEEQCPDRQADDKLSEQLLFAGQPKVAFLLDLDEVIQETNRRVPSHRDQPDDHITISDVRPQQRRNKD